MDKTCVPRVTVAGTTGSSRHREQECTSKISTIPVGKAETRSLIIFRELVQQLPSFSSSETFDFGWEVDKQLRLLIGGTRITSILFRGMSFRDALSQSSVAILDFSCHMSSRACKGTVVAIQGDPSGNEHVTILHSTTPEMSAGKEPLTQEWSALSRQLQCCGGNDETITLLKEPVDLSHANWGGNNILLVGEGRELQRTKNSRSVRSDAVAAIRRMCAWGVIGASQRKSDFRFFATCLLGLFSDTIYTQRFERNTTNMQFSAIPLVRTEHGNYRTLPGLSLFFVNS